MSFLNRFAKSCLWLPVLWLAGAAHAGCADADALTRVTRAITVDGQSRSEVVALPDFLPVAVRNERHAIRYQIDVSACAALPSRALWLFRAGAPYRVLDDQGRPLALLGTGTPLRMADAAGLARSGAYNGRIPALYALPPGTRQVSVELLTLPYIPAGLVKVREGPIDLLLPVQAQALRETVTSADTASGIVFVLGLFAVLLWTQRRDDKSLLWLAVACAMWGLRGVAYFNPQVYGSALAFELFNPINALLALSALAASLLTRSGVLVGRARRLLLGMAVLGPGSVVLAGLAGAGAAAARFLCFVFVIAIMSWLIVHTARRRRQTSSLLLCVVLVLLFGTVLHDLMVVAGVRPPDSPSIVFWGFAVLIVGVCLISGQYVVSTLNRAERSNEELAQRIAQKSEELESSYSQLRESEQENARTAERERLIRDLHDGLSAHLMTTLRGVERGALAPQALAGSLQESLDELRMLMDSSDIGRYLPGALAAWRSRWDARLEAAGIALGWHIDDSVDDVELPGSTTLQVMRILQEAAANVVKHAGAQAMHLSARVDLAPEGPRLRIEIADDGVGMTVVPVQGQRGLRNMAHRAGQVGGRLEFGAGRDGRGTTVALLIPLQDTSPRRLASIVASAREFTPSFR